MSEERKPRAKKGAHYSAPTPHGTPGGLGHRLRRLAIATLSLAALAVVPLAPTRVLAAPAPASRPEDARKAEEQLQAVKAEIERVTREVSAEQVERDRLTRELRGAELAVANARNALAGVRHERAEDAARRAALATEKRTRETQLEENRAALAGQMFAYYSYFGRARAGQIRLIEDDVRRLAELDAELEAEDAKLAELEKEQRAQLGDLEQARERRNHVLVSLEAQSRSRAQNLERLRAQQSGLEKLVRELRAAMQRFPVEGNDAFTRLRGKLAWPVSGHLVARFGDARAGGVRWDGVLVATERGAPVKAVCPGRVIYADWLPGLGLLAIVDHGDGYLSLYGHNERLYKAAGEQVAAGDTIAAAGDSGGSPRPELYFEIRKGGKPVDPRPWFRAPDP